MITLYHSPQTRSASIVWLLEELEVPYQTKVVDFRRMDGSGSRDPANPHPHSKVPALADGDDVVFEGSAIALYLTDKYRKKKLGPGVMEPALICRRFDFKHVFGAMGWAPADEVEEVLNQHLASRKFFLGDDFSAVDIMLGGGVHFMLMAKMLKDTPVMKEYAARVIDRPAFRKMMEADKK